MDKIQRSQNAERILNDETFQEAVNMLREEYIGVFKYPKSSQEEIMEAHNLLRLVDKLESSLKSFAMDGELAERRQKKGMAP